jgi:hypothetical protein
VNFLSSMRSRIVIGAAALVVIAGLVVAVVLAGQHGTPAASGSPSAASTANSPAVNQSPVAQVASRPQAADAALPICGQKVLDSPYDYAGSASKFSSGKKFAHARAMPTFGTKGSDFPKATSGVIIPAGDDSGLSVLNNPSTVYYFEPGDHTSVPYIEPGNDSVYLGGYSAAASPPEAEIDGGGHPGDTLNSTASGVYVEYLTVAHFDSTNQMSQHGGSYVDQDQGNDWTVNYDTIGPNTNTFAHDPGAAGPGGYGLDIGSNSTYEYDCVTGNGEGGFNGAGGPGSIIGDPDPWGGPQNWTIKYCEISGNAKAAGETSTGGRWEDPGGVAAGIKVFWTENGTFDDNYVYDNWGEGVWPDTNNSGMQIDGNVILDNFDSGIVYEASFNAQIDGNLIEGNGYAALGPKQWPGYPTGYETQNYGGPDFVDRAIYINNSGGSTSMPSSEGSRYLGHLYIDGNILRNNFGGIALFMDRNRFCGEGADGGQGTCTLNGNFRHDIGTTYYETPTSYSDRPSLKSGSKAVSVSPGFQSNYSGAKTMPAKGWLVGLYNPSSGQPIAGVLPAGDKIASCSSNASCTLTAPATATVSNGSYPGGPAELEAGPPGGCGLYDLTGAGPGKVTGSPAEPYFANCNWDVQGVTISGNTFATDANPTGSYKAGQVTDCTAALGCGYMVNYANTGACTNGCEFSPYAGQADADFVKSPASGNKWSDNTYAWTGTSAGWSFELGGTGQVFTSGQWCAAGQDTSSSGSQGIGC